MVIVIVVTVVVVVVAVIVFFLALGVRRHVGKIFYFYFYFFVFGGTDIMHLSDGTRVRGAIGILYVYF